MALDRRTRVLGAVLRRVTGPVATMPPDKRQALRGARAPRVLTDYLNGRPASGVTATDCSVPSGSGPLGVRIYRPAGQEGHRLPVIVAFHGGGWMFGDLDTARWLWSHVAARVPAVVVAGTYRLAPENPAPAALEDAFAITAWAAEHAADLGGGPDRVGVMGESSGGTLAASVALRARDTGAFPLRCQALIYPITDLTLSSPSIRLMPEEPVLTSSDLTSYVQAYLGPDGSPTHPHVSPLLAEDHRGLPAAVVVSADHDPLRDDARRYAEQLRACGVPVESVELVDSPHGVFSFPNLCRASGPALDALVAGLRRALGVEPTAGWCATTPSLGSLPVTPTTPPGETT
jgi:acetyl esterase